LFFGVYLFMLSQLLLELQYLQLRLLLVLPILYIR